MADFPTVPRHLRDSVIQALGHARVVLVNGPRQAGKTTLVRELVEGEGAPRDYLSLDDAGVLTAARRDPAGFVAGLSTPVAIDEVQRAPELFRAIKVAVDRDRRPGRFLLTGSANVLLLPRLADALVGRMEILTLWPLSEGERQGIREGFVDAVFGDGPPVLKPVSRRQADLVERLLTGGFPEPALRGRRDAWFRGYVTTLLERDVRDLARLDQLTVLPPLLDLLAARSGSLFNTAELSRISALPHNTVRRYVALFEALYLTRRLPAWSGSATKRLAKTPKLVFTDTGLMSHLLQLSPERLRATPTLIGPLLENFVVMEIGKQLGWSRAQPALFHYRAHAGHEVDVVLEGAAGRLVGIEVKASSTISASDLRGLRALQADRPQRFHRGVILYRGQTVIPFGPRLHALPIDALWRWGAR
ncbi:MAG: ATP-binding protein [Gammaproteobacteria bacterium]